MIDPREQLSLIDSLRQNHGYQRFLAPAIEARVALALSGVLEDKLTPEERDRRHAAYMAVKEMAELVQSHESAMMRLIHGERPASANRT